MPGMPPPYYGQGFGAAYREYDALVMPKGGQLASVCAKCANPQTAAAPRKSFGFTPQWVYLVFMISPLIGLILSAAMRKSAAFNIPLCQACDQSWKAANRNLLLSFLPGLGMFILGIILCVVDLDDVGGPLIVISLLVLLFAPLVVNFGFRRRRIMWAKRIDDRYAVLAGMHQMAIEASVQPQGGNMQMGMHQQQVPMMPGQPYVPPHLMR
jgi:hypothetical protein